MKKTAILLTIALVVGISLAAYAAATQYTLSLGGAKSTPPTESGFAIVNDNPQKTVIQIQVRGLPSGNYYAFYKKIENGSHNYYPLGQLKVNKIGSGHLHKNETPRIERPYWIGVLNTSPAPHPWWDYLVLWAKVE